VKRFGLRRRTGLLRNNEDPVGEEAVLLASTTSDGDKDLKKAPDLEKALVEQHGAVGRGPGYPILKVTQRTDGGRFVGPRLGMERLSQAPQRRGRCRG